MSKPKNPVDSVFTSQGYKNGYADGLRDGEKRLAMAVLKHMNGLIKIGTRTAQERADLDYMIDWLSARLKRRKK